MSVGVDKKEQTRRSDVTEYGRVASIQKYENALEAAGVCKRKRLEDELPVTKYDCSLSNPLCPESRIPNITNLSLSFLPSLSTLYL